MWSCDFLEKALSVPFLGQWLPTLANCDLSWVDYNHWVTWPVYQVITLYLQKSASPVLQRQWPSNLVGLWLRVKEPHLLFQVNCRSSDRVLFEKHRVFTNAGLQNWAGDIKQKNLRIKSFFCYLKDINIWFISIYTTVSEINNQKNKKN